ncbi:hypothetical protein REPUB_Repub05bG0168700 [Reevesia pubescens]
MSVVPGDHSTDKNLIEQETDSSSQRIAKNEANELDVASSLGVDVGDTSTSKSNADLKSLDEKPTGDVGDNSGRFNISNKETSKSRQTDLEPHKDLVSKNTIKGEAIEDLKDVDNGEHKIEENKFKDSPLLKTPPLQEVKLGEEHNGKMQKEKILPQDQGTPKGLVGNGFRSIPSSSQVQPGSFLQPSHSISFVD